MDDAIDWYSEDAATFGDRLAAARDASGMTQKQLARRLGVKLNTLVGWEEDLAEPRANKLSMVAGLLNVSMMWLITGQGDGLDAPTSAEPMPGDLSDMLIEMRQLRNGLLAQAEQVARMEKRLRTALMAANG